MERPKSNIKTICLVLVYQVAFERYKTKRAGRALRKSDEAIRNFVNFSE